MSPEVAATQLTSIARYRITRAQSLLAVVTLIAILLLGISSILEARSAGERSQILSNVETPAASIIFTQRETLVYATRLALWSNGGTTRRNVQIARNLLAQRLSVVDSSGETMGSRANNKYWRALRASDAIVDAAPMGILPEVLHPSINAELLPVIDEILAEARNLVVSYQRSVDQEMIEKARETARWDSLNLFLLYCVILLGGFFLFLNARSNFKNYHLAREAIVAEQLRLEETIAKLESAQRTVAQLQDLDSAKNALISTVNHELRTPLTSIIGYVELMQRDPSSQSTPEMKLYLEVLDRNSQILLNLVESMLSLSKFDSAEGKLPDQPVLLNDIIENVIYTLQPTANKTGVSIAFSAKAKIFVRGDLGQLTQVFVNILTNAVKFSPVDSVVSVNLHDTPTGFAEVSITDHGIGIPEEDLPFIFGRFFRAKNVSNGDYEGTGLGLAIVERIVKHHHGTIRVGSNREQGTVFTVEIPKYVKGDSHE